MRRTISIIAALALWGPTHIARRSFLDQTHPSNVFGEARHYRIFLPLDYDSGTRAYPVIYYFHGHSDRYTLENYDDGKDTVPKIAAFVATRPVIVVSVDGYVARDYQGFYGGTPWDIMETGGEYDFGAYFRELVSHIDSTYRTLTSRRYRATSGLSMGGFMSLYLSARFPDLVGSASAFNPGPEFYVGDKGRRVLWRPKDHVTNHTRTMVRLVRASGDYISQYHEETRDAYARADDVDFEYRRDEYHRHWATSVDETFNFHLRAFANSSLDNFPDTWSHSDAYADFTAWDYHVKSSGEEAGINYLEDVNQGGLRVTTRRWAPDGPPLSHRGIAITTAPLYQPSASYLVSDRNFSAGATSQQTLRATAEGRLLLATDGADHQFSFAGPGATDQAPVVLPLTTSDKLRLPPRLDLALPIRIYNPRNVAMTNVKVTLSSEYPTVQLLSSQATIPRIEPGAAADLADRMRARFTAGEGYFAQTRLKLDLVYDGWHTVSKNLDFLVIPEEVPPAAEVIILDGRTVTLKVFRQKGNQGGGESVARILTEGEGNGNGILEPGEEATLWVRLRQGMDPFDKDNWYRAKVYSDSPWVTEVTRLEEQKGLEWTSGEISPASSGFCPARRAAHAFRCSSTTNPGALCGRPMYVTETKSSTKHFSFTRTICTGMSWRFLKGQSGEVLATDRINRATSNQTTTGISTSVKSFLRTFTFMTSFVSPTHGGLCHLSALRSPRLRHRLFNNIDRETVSLRRTDRVVELYLDVAPSAFPITASSGHAKWQRMRPPFIWPEPATIAS